MKRKISKNLLINNKSIMADWDYAQNNAVGLYPDKLTVGSHKEAFWHCHIHDVSYKQIIKNRYAGERGCEKCLKEYLETTKVQRYLKGKKPLSETHPDLLKEWDYTKNTISPAQVTAGSKKVVWWKCAYGHEWQAQIQNRTSGSRCIYCAGQKPIVGKNDLSVTNPKLIKEWDWEKNGQLSPTQFMRGSNTKVWWKCPLGHSWAASISKRANGTGCPHCYSENGTSFPEQAILFYLSQKLPVEGRKQIEGHEVDIFIESKSIGFEYDGQLYHSSEKSKIKELCKDKFFSQIGIHLYHIKETDHFDFDKENLIIYCKVDHSYDYLSYVLTIIEDILKVQLGDINIERDRAFIYAQYIKSVKQNSLKEKRPDLVKEWDFSKNQGLLPENFTLGSNKKVWWICSKCGSSYCIDINHRTNGTNCPYCDGKKVNETNCLQIKYPDVAKYWDEKKNLKLPTQIYFRSTKKVWWLCPSCGNSFQAPVCSRVRAKTALCPSCMHIHIGNKNRELSLSKTTSLRNSGLPFLEEWNYEKNIDISPEEVTPNSGKKVWWKCCVCGYEWQTAICNRYSGTGCPNCAGRKAGAKRAKKINVYLLTDFSFYGTYNDAKQLCAHFGVDYQKQAGNISAVCHRRNKSFLGKYILRYADDDEIKKKD